MNDQVSVLFRELADLAPAEREKIFAARDVAPEVQAEVESLLAFDSAEGDSVTRCIGEAANAAVRPSDEGKLKLCGPYRPIRLLGSGGMGSVYLAERADGEIQQRVAIKMLRAGADQSSWQERFLRERQFLAYLNHPCIARMLDASRTANGEPYLVMEYVEGLPIDVYAESKTLREKLALFLNVCDAVAHAHRHLIVHRDLKPSNILVDKSGQPKLLDFGIAKVLDDTSDQTQTVERLLTPSYASPEQIRGTIQTTATDIYSLGAVLYKMLTGRSPHESPTGELQAIDVVAGVREIPGARRLNPAVPGDVDCILQKALRSAAEERYVSVEAFASDIRSFLDSRPVTARSASAWYFTRKFVRRYWMPVGAAALVIASLSTGLYVADRQRLVADRQRLVAERRFSQLRHLAHQILFDLYGTITNLPGAIDAQTKLVATSSEYLAGLSADAIRDKQLALEVSESYIQLARIQGVPAWNNLGQYAEALENLRKADRLLDPIVAANPHDRYAIYLSGNAAHDRVIVADAAGQPEQMIAEASKVRERFDQLVRLGNLTRKEINAATYIYGDLAEHLIHLHRFQDAARYARAGIEISRTDSTIAGPRAETFSDLACALKYLGDFQGALDAAREARSEWQKYQRYEKESPAYYWPPYARLALSTVRSQEGLLLEDDGGVDLSEPLKAAILFREAYDAVEQNARNEAKDYLSRGHLAEDGFYLGNALRHSSPKQALEVYDHSLMRIREVPSDIQALRQEASLLAASSYPARRLDQVGDARVRIDAAFRLLRDTKDYPAEMIKPGSEADNVARALADHYAETGETNQALETYRDLRVKILKSNPDQQNDLLSAAQLSRLDGAMAALLRRVGRTDEALSLDQNRLELWRHWDRKLPNNPFVQRQIARKLYWYGQKRVP